MKKHEIILNIINKELEIDINEITRERKYVDGRSIFYWLCTHYTDLNFSQISKLLGKNHATVLHSIKNFPYIIEYDVELKEMFDKIHMKVLAEIDSKNKEMSIDEMVSSHNYLLLENESLKKRISDLENQNELLKKQIIHGK